MRPHLTAVILAALLSTTTAQSQTPGIPNMGSIALSRIDRDRLRDALKSEPTPTELAAPSDPAKTHQSMVERAALRPLLPTVTGTATVQTAHAIDVDPPPLAPGFWSDRRQRTCHARWQIAGDMGSERVGVGFKTL